jgi:hypothetical protein
VGDEISSSRFVFEMIYFLSVINDPSQLNKTAAFQFTFMNEAYVHFGVYILITAALSISRP